MLPLRSVTTRRGGSKSGMDGILADRYAEHNVELKKLTMEKNREKKHRNNAEKQKPLYRENSKWWHCNRNQKV